jgi:hypothetical protein
MENLDSKRKLLNKQQTELRKIMATYQHYEIAIQMFLVHHARLHTAKMVETKNNLSQTWSYEDVILNDLTEDQLRCIPKDWEHSIVWCIWHLARIEDVAMNMLVAGTQQVLENYDWFDRMKVQYHDTGNEMDGRDLTLLSNTIDIGALRAYRTAVGRRTQEIVKLLSPEQIKEKVNPERIQQVKEKGALVEAAYGIADYWSKRDIAGLLLMPATRHNLVHLNEASRIKNRIQK